MAPPWLYPISSSLPGQGLPGLHTQPLSCGLEWSTGLPGGGGMQAKPDGMADAALKSFLILLLLSAF